MTSLVAREVAMSCTKGWKNAKAKAAAVPTSRKKTFWWEIRQPHWACIAYEALLKMERELAKQENVSKRIPDSRLSLMTRLFQWLGWCKPVLSESSLKLGIPHIPTLGGDNIHKRASSSSWCQLPGQSGCLYTHTSHTPSFLWSLLVYLLVALLWFPETQGLACHSEHGIPVISTDCDQWVLH